MKTLGVLLFALSLTAVTLAQFKTGIKTHYTNQQRVEENSGSLILGNSTQTYGYGYNQSSEGGSYNAGYNGGYNGGYNNNINSQYDRNHGYVGYIPAETYQPNEPYRPPPTQAPRILDATAEFINKTRAGMASGVCFKEVPTSSLVRGAPDVIPAGNGTTPNMSKIQVCCEGYDRNPHVFARCDPICPDNCPNGICTAPNTCVCIPGHVRNHEGKCISTCPLGCGNGVCNDHGECQCKPGYTIEPAQRKYCVPQCEPACQFGKCVAPNKCDCLEGYRLTAEGTCEPRCDNCDNGKCTAPGYCTCNQGYLKAGAVCEPVCNKGCNKGRCVAPETCACAAGFELDATKANCVPHCDQPCLNGVCDGNNSCLCNAGYIQDEYQRNICKPHCPQGCPNGYCTSPNFCICKPGFIKSGIKGRQSCMPV